MTGSIRTAALLLAASALASAPAVAQHSGHNMPGMTMPQPPTKKPPAKKSGAKKPVAKKSAAKKSAPKKPVAKKSAAKKATTRKPAPGDSSPATTPPADHLPGHVMPQSVNPNAEHVMPPSDGPNADQSMPGMDAHAGHDMGKSTAEVPVGPPPTGALAGPARAAEQVWGLAAMAGSQERLVREHGAVPLSKVSIGRAEARLGEDRDGWLVDGEAWFGGDIHKTVVKLEGEGPLGRRAEHLEAQLLWSRAIARYFDFQAGVRADLEPRRRARLVVGVEGLAPYWLHADAAAFLSTRGDITARIEVSHDMRITQKWVLQPRVEADAALQNIADEGIGRGLSSASIGLRLGYALEPNVIPYVGVDYGRAFGRAADYRRREEEKAGELRAVIGLRGFF